MIALAKILVVAVSAGTVAVIPAAENSAADPVPRAPLVHVLLEYSFTVDPASAVPVTLGVVEVDGEAGAVAVTVGLAVCGAEPGSAPRRPPPCC